MHLPNLTAAPNSSAEFFLSKFNNQILNVWTHIEETFDQTLISKPFLSVDFFFQVKTTPFEHISNSQFQH